MSNRKKYSERKKILLVDAIIARCPVFARAVCAIVNVLLAVFAFIPVSADASARVSTEKREEHENEKVGECE